MPLQILPPNLRHGGYITKKAGEGIEEGLAAKFAERNRQLAEAHKRDEHTRDMDRREKEFLERGVPPKMARLMAAATVGGQTGMFNVLSDQMQRDPNALNQSQQPEQAGMGVPGVYNDAYPTITDPYEGMKPAERVKHRSDLTKEQEPLHSAMMDRIVGATKRETELGTLSALNDTGKLPSGAGRFNVDVEGNLKIPFAATPESQRFVKTVNQFVREAKESFGAKVSNFELGAFMRQLPTLSNTQEGRRQIIKQMRLFAKMDKVYDETLRETLKHYGGVGKANWADIREVAFENAKPKVEDLIKEVNAIGGAQSLPSASENKGATWMNGDTGQYYKSDGSQWVEVPNPKQKTE